MNEEPDNVVSFPDRIPNRHKMADYADKASQTFSSLAFVSEVAARVMKAAARELSKDKK